MASASAWDNLTCYPSPASPSSFEVRSLHDRRIIEDIWWGCKLMHFQAYPRGIIQNRRMNLPLSTIRLERPAGVVSAPYREFGMPRRSSCGISMMQPSGSNEGVVEIQLLGDKSFSLKPDASGATYHRDALSLRKIHRWWESLEDFL